MMSRRRASDTRITLRERLRAAYARDAYRQSQFSIVSAIFAATLAVILMVDYLVGHPHIERVAVAIWMGCYALFVIAPLVLGRRYPGWAGLVFIAYLTFWSVFSLARTNHPHMELNVLLEAPIVAVYLGWFYRPAVARIVLGLYLLAMTVFVLFLRPPGAEHAFSSELTLLYAVLIAGFCLETGRHLSRRAEQQAIRDPLTGALNRRGLALVGGRLLSRARRARRAVTLVAIDFDDFKAINDTGGHAAGDAALRESVALWSHELEGDGIVARTGGDEFALLIPADEREAGERLAALSAGAPYAWSWGLAERRPGEKLRELMRRADVELYRAKERSVGRVGRSAADSPIEGVRARRPILGEW